VVLPYASQTRPELDGAASVIVFLSGYASLVLAAALWAKFDREAGIHG